MSSTTVTPVITVPACPAADRIGVAAAAESPARLKPQAAVAKPEVAQREEPQTALQQLAAEYTSSSTDLRFSVDAVTGQTIVAVVSREDGTLLRQMPSEVALRVAQALAAPLRGKLIDGAA